MAGRRIEWFKAVLLYTLAGAVTSALVGAALALLGRALLPEQASRPGLVLALVVAAIALARELGWIRFPLPQVRRQTEDRWAKSAPGPVAAMLWGADIGLTFTTYLTFSGVWLLAAVALLTRQPATGAALLTAYWMGRALSTWLGPLMTEAANAIPSLVAELSRQQRLFQLLQVGGIAWIVSILAWCLFTGAVL